MKNLGIWIRDKTFRIRNTDKVPVENVVQWSVPTRAHNMPVLAVMDNQSVKVGRKEQKSRWLSGKLLILA
jgi:hypothetical protein